MPNTILYYPKIAIPDGAWLRQALLYWDRIGSIIPREFDRAGHDLQDLHILHELNVYRSYNPEDFIVGDQRLRIEFEQEFIHISKKPSFWRRLPPPEARRFDSPIHIAKITDDLSEYVQSKGLAILRDRYDSWYQFERSAAWLYVSLLAKYMADSAEETTIPGTDFGLFKDFIFQTEKRNFSASCFELTLQDILPVPSQDTPLEKILEFKAKRKDELISFREVIWGIQDELKNSQEISEIRNIVSRHSDLLNTRVTELSETMYEEKLQLWRGSLETLIKTDSIPSLSLVFDPFQIPIEYKLAGLGVMGVISVSNYLLDHRNERRKLLRENCFSYLYHAKQEAII
jgi:hypothetical protein